MRSYGVTNAAPYASAPAVGAAGDTYFNTTSKTLWVSDGTTWMVQDPSLGSLGIVAVGSVTDGLTVATAPSYSVHTTTINFTPVVGRRYRIGFSSRALGPAGSITWNLFNGAAKDTTVNPTDYYSAVERNYGSIHATWMADGDGAARTWTIRAQSATASLQAYGGNFYVEDVGPNQSPALPIPATPPGWTALAMNANWSNIGGTGAPLSYRKIGDVVYLRGEIHFVGGGSNPMATLPAGFRPAYAQTYAVGNRTNSNTALVMTIDTVGACQLGGLSGTTDFGLGNISFSTTP